MGLLEAVSLGKNTSVQTSGTAFAASILKSMMQDVWDQSNGQIPTDLYTGSYIRATIDEFVTKSNISVPGSQKEMIRAVSVFETSFGRLRLHTHRHIYVSGTDSYGKVLLCNPDKLKIAYLRKPYIDTGLSRSGDYDQRAVVGKLTLEVRNQETNNWHDGFNVG